MTAKLTSSTIRVPLPTWAVYSLADALAHHIDGAIDIWRGPGDYLLAVSDETNDEDIPQEYHHDGVSRPENIE